VFARRWTVISLALAGGALSACGTSTRSASVPAARASGASITPAQPTATRARARTYAAAVNLKRSDMLGMSVSKPESELVAPTRSTEELARCAGEIDPNALVLDGRSPTFDGVVNGEHETISSNVEVLPSVTLTRQHFIAQDSGRALSCLTRTIRRELEAQDGTRVHFGRVSISRLPEPANIPNSEAVRVTVPILGVPSQIANEPAYSIDALAFISGASEVAITATAFPRPVPSSAEQSILSLLYHRATTHSL
jgi:hypothetical protein